MSIKYNNSTVNGVYFGNNRVKKVIYNGNTVFFPQVIVSCHMQSAERDYPLEVSVTNNKCIMDGELLTLIVYYSIPTGYNYKTLHIDNTTTSFTVDLSDIWDDRWTIRGVRLLNNDFEEIGTYFFPTSGYNLTHTFTANLYHIYNSVAIVGYTDNSGWFNGINFSVLNPQFLGNNELITVKIVVYRAFGSGTYLEYERYLNKEFSDFTFNVESTIYDRVYSCSVSSSYGINYGSFTYYVNSDTTALIPIFHVYTRSE